MARVDDGGGPCAKVDARHLTGHELAGLRIFLEIAVRADGLLRQSDTGAARIPQRAHKVGGKHCRVDRLLRQSSLVVARPEGRRVRYRLYDHHVAELLVAIRHHAEHVSMEIDDTVPTRASESGVA